MKEWWSQFSKIQEIVLFMLHGSYSNDHLHVCEGRCIRCLSTMDEHLNDDNSDEGDQITCGDCG